MRIRSDNKHAIIIVIGILIVILLVLLDIIRNNSKGQDYSNLTDEEISVAIKKEVDEMELNTLASKNERDRIEYYVAQFVEAIESKKYEDAYDMLYEDFKNNYFPTLSSFEEYAQSKFSKVLSLEHTNFERNGDYYILWTKISDPLSGKGSGKEINFVVRENDLNDFDMSFSVI